MTADAAAAAAAAADGGGDDDDDQRNSLISTRVDFVHGCRLMRKYD